MTLGLEGGGLSRIKAQVRRSPRGLLLARGRSRCVFTAEKLLGSQKGNDPIISAPPCDLNCHLPETSFPNTIALGVRASV